MSTTAKKKGGFTAEEKAAMKARAKELKEQTDGETAVREAIAKMSPSDRAIAKKLHDLITAAAPGLTPKTWYGMPAYAKDGKVVCFFIPVSDMPKGSASSLIVARPEPSRSRTARRVGSARAANARSTAV